MSELKGVPAAPAPRSPGGDAHVLRRSWPLARLSVVLLFLAAVAGFLLVALRSPRGTVTINLVVRDGALRRLGADCSGSGPLLHIHRGAPYRIADGANGRTLMSSTLPGGIAVGALNVTFKVPRVPTVCRFRLSVRLLERDRYALHLARGKPIRFARSQIDSRTSSITLGAP
jgi:hypothetical protein